MSKKDVVENAHKKPEPNVYFSNEEINGLIELTIAYGKAPGTNIDSAVSIKNQLIQKFMDYGLVKSGK